MAIQKGGIRVPIVSVFVDKGVKDAMKGFTSLEATAGTLGKKLGSALAVSSVIAFGKSSVEAFMKSESSAKQLANTMTNLGLAFQTDGIENYIKKTELLTGISHDQLRPAFQSLVVATDDAAKAQDQLNVAIDVSKATGKDLASVTGAMAKAYGGNTAALGRLGVGIDKATLASGNFDAILKELRTNFSGAAATAADTLKGKIDRLKTSFELLKEEIGKGIVDALTNATSGGTTDIETLQKAMEGLGKAISDVLMGISDIVLGIEQIARLPIVSQLLKFAGGVAKYAYKNSAVGALQALGASTKANNPLTSANTSHAYAAAQLKKQNEALAKQATARKAVLDAAKKQAAADAAAAKAAKDKLALDKASLALKQAESIFNMDKIEIEAALLQKQTSEDYARLQLKKDLITLQEAISAGDATAATAAANAVNADYKRVQAYQALNVATEYQKGLITNISELVKAFPDAKKLIDLDNLNAALDAIKAIATALSNIKMPSLTSGATSIAGTKDYGGNIIGSPVPQSVADAYNNIFGQAPNYGTSAPTDISGGSYLSLPSAPTSLMNGSYLSGSTVNVTVQGSVTTQQDLVSAIIDGIQQNTASGIKTTVNRLNPEYF